MISIILFILIGIELNMMNGLYLALIITRIILWILEVLLKVFKLGLGVKE